MPPETKLSVEFIIPFLFLLRTNPRQASQCIALPCTAPRTFLFEKRFGVDGSTEGAGKTHSPTGATRFLLLGRGRLARRHYRVEEERVKPKVSE